MKRLFALALALMLALSCAAVAEPGTAYMAAIIDPVVSMNGEPLVDLTGLDVELTAMVTDTELLGAVIGAYAGENHDIPAVVARGQLDNNGLTFTADGMSNVYGLNLSNVIGVNPAFFLSGLSLDSTLKELAASYEPVEFDPSMRVMLIQGMFQSFTTGETADGTTFAIDREKGREMLQQFAATVDQYAAAAGESSNLAADLAADGICFELSGSMKQAGDTFELTANGALVDSSNATVPFSITYTDTLATYSLDFLLTAVDEEPGTETLAVYADSVTEEGGKVVTNARIVIDEEAATLDYVKTPAGVETEHSLLFKTPVQNEIEVKFTQNAGCTDENDVGFSFEGRMTDSGSVMDCYVNFLGETYSDETSSVLYGNLSAGAMSNQYAVTTGVMLASVPADTAAWQYDSASYVDVTNMSDSDNSAAMMGLMGLLGSAYPVLEENVPGLSMYLDELLGGLM